MTDEWSPEQAVIVHSLRHALERQKDATKIANERGDFWRIESEKYERSLDAERKLSAALAEALRWLWDWYQVEPANGTSPPPWMVDAVSDALTAWEGRSWK